MKFPKLRWLPTISVLFLSGFHFLFSQVLSPPTLSSTHGNGPVISVCDSETVTFTATGDLGPTANDAEFRIIRAGVILYPLGAPGPQSILSFSSSSLQNGDQVVATVWTYDYGPAGGASSTTNTITISLDDYPLPISFTSDANGNLICENDNVLFSASTASTNTLFQFFVDGISLQGPSLVSTLSHAFSTSSTVTLIASLGSCSRQLELPLQVVSVVPCVITSGGEYCYADIPSPINSFSFGQIDGTNLVTSTSTNLYQWESSVDGVNWSEILNATGLNYTPPSLNQTTHFRRKIRSNNSGTICEAVSNQITINVLPLINPGYIEQGDQYFCLNDTFPTLTVTQSTVSAGILYQWQQSTNNGTSYSNIPLATAKEYTPSGLTQTTLFRRATYSNSGSGCTSTTLPVQFTLLDINSGSLDTSQNSTIGNGSVPPTLISGATGADATSAVGTISYQWQQSVDNSNWSTITTATSASYAPLTLTVSTYYRRIAFANTGSSQCSDTTNAILISVRNEINAGALLGNQIFLKTICRLP